MVTKAQMTLAAHLHSASTHEEAEFRRLSREELDDASALRRIAK